MVTYGIWTVHTYMYTPTNHPTCTCTLSNYLSHTHIHTYTINFRATCIRVVNFKIYSTEYLATMHSHVHATIGLDGTIVFIKKPKTGSYCHFVSVSQAGFSLAQTIQCY